VTEGAALYQRTRSGSLDFGLYFQQAQAALPGWLHDLLAHFDLFNMDSLRDKLSQGAIQASRFLATRAVSIGQDTFQFVINLGIMLYLLFFLLRDGAALSRRMLRAIPLSDGHKEPLMQKFTTVVRATVKGNVAVAAAQGVLGGFIFWALGIQGALLWGVIMGFLSLLPAVGSALVWVPVAAYFLLTGALWQGIVLVLFCVLVIGMVDNLLRPLLVGKETKLPDYVILISTLGGMALVGLNGFVIGPLVAALFMAAWDLFSPHEE
jgi:predicted PurR-regulated permease PerM